MASPAMVGFLTSVYRLRPCGFILVIAGSAKTGVFAEQGVVSAFALSARSPVVASRSFVNSVFAETGGAGPPVATPGVEVFMGYIIAWALGVPGVLLVAWFLLHH
jgi:hypothetical protein